MKFDVSLAAARWRPALFPLLALCVFAAASAASATTGTGPPSPNYSAVTVVADGSSVSRHRILIAHGRSLSYTARAGFIPLVDGRTNEVTGSMFFVAYVADRAPGETARPLTFVWGGGPGGAATLSREGPRIVPRGGSDVVDNPDTWLVKSDLVLIDTMGTGLSRLTKPEYSSLYYGVKADAEAATEFIRIYLKRYETSDRAIFLAGGSYGSIRCAMVADAAERRGIPIRGLIMSANGPTYSYSHDSPDLYKTFLIPAFTYAAYAHHRLPPDLQADIDKARTEAEHWAATEYAQALTLGNRLPDAERKQVVAHMARYTGLDPVVIERHNLRLSAPEFGDELLADEHKVVGLYDSRIATAAQQGPWDPTKDPSLMARGVAYPSAGERLYLARELGVKSDLLYAGPFGGDWPPPAQPFGDWMAVKWGESLGADDPAPGAELVTPALLHAFEANPRLLAIMENGHYDMVAPYGGTQYLQSRLPPDQKDRVVVRTYESGHGGAGDEFRQDVFMFYDRVLGASAK